MKASIFFSFLLIQSMLVISVVAQNVSEYVKTNHYTYKCAYCKLTKKEDIIDIGSIKNSEISKKASNIALINAMFNAASNSGPEVCDISRTGKHRYELINKSVTQELYKANKEETEKTKSANKGFDYNAAEKPARQSSNYAGTKKVFIKSAHGNYFLNHSISNKSLSLADQPYNASTGAYDGELWEIITTEGGKSIIKSAHGNYFLNHSISNKSLSLVDQPYNPSTGAYDGELWEVIATGGGKLIIKSAHGNYFLNHSISNKSLSLVDQPYNPSTGAYDGELWEIVYR